MLSYSARNSSKRTARGRGLVNTLINKLPFEAHIPGYKFCGPGTRLKERLARGDRGINPLDEACKTHDIAYTESTDISARHEADKILAEKALARFRSTDASLGEKAAALGVAGIMKAKRKFGMGVKSKKTTPKRRRKLEPKLNLIKTAKLALSSIKKNAVLPKKRVIPVPKKGGILPLIPIFAALSALGTIGGGAAGIAKAVNDARSAAEQLKEAQRHNKTMESIAIGKGLYLKPYKSGLGLYRGSNAKNY